jgi:hypothetical protein
MFDSTGALCAQTDPELFFPENFSSIYETHAVLKLCSNCPVYVKCRDFALNHDVYGWWAGTTRAERSAIQKERGITPKRIPSFYETSDVNKQKTVGE